MTAGGTGTGGQEPDYGTALFARPVKPRSIKVHEAAVNATRDLLAEGGLPAATIDAIAARSGVSKATLYKHWPSRTAVAAEAFGRDMADAVPASDTGTTAGDLAEQVLLVSRFYASPEGTVFSQLLAATVTDEGGAAYFRAWFLAGRRKAIAAIWQRGAERGDVRPGVDADTAIDLLFGPRVYRLLTGHLPLTDEAATAVADAALHGLLTTTPED
jgi:AcrR family transcriptional regulator